MGMPVIIPGSITQERAVGDLIESIAMEESALAHILNAESEKLLAVINRAATTYSELLAVNRSVESTVREIIRLELLLQAKLNLFRDAVCLM